MILTDALIEQLHEFRVELLKGSIRSLQTAIPRAAGISTGGGYARFAGDGSPLTQAYGIGHRDAAYDLREIDEFYAGLATTWELIVTPFSSPTILKDATRFGYLPDHFESVLAKVSDPKPFELPNGVTIEESIGDPTEWARTSDAAWSELDGLPEEPSMLAIGMTTSPARRFLARVEGIPAATASLIIIGNTALFAGGATRPGFRNRGLQLALLHHRMNVAGNGTLAQVVAVPGSQSHRNIQRLGFQPLYSKLVMLRAQ